MKVNLMKLIKTILFLFGLGIVNSQAAENCFIAKENGQIVKQLGECTQRHSPVSTFKVPLAVIGFDAGILKTPSEPVMAFTEENKRNMGSLYDPKKYPIQLLGNRPQTPATWMQYSVIWYSQEITQKLGMQRLREYLNKLNYGNEDVSGTPGKNDGLLQSWIFNSLQISPKEQIEFVEKLSNKQLPLSKQAQENTIKIINLEKIWDNWQLYGKTGGGMKAGWFIGWIEKDNRRIQFAQYVEQENALISGGKMAKEIAKDNLISLMLLSNS